MATNNSINSRELIKTNNLSDLTNTTTARTNLGSGAVGGNTSFATTFIAYDGGGDFYQFGVGLSSFTRMGTLEPDCEFW